MDLEIFSSLVIDTLNRISIKTNYRGQSISIKKISTDSRTGCKDAAFIALNGLNHRGVRFVKAAFLKGSRLCCVNREDWNLLQKSLPKEMIYFMVEDTQETLGFLAQKYLSLWQGKKIAITGSAGKTTLKENLAHFLSRSSKVFKSKKNWNNIIGVALNIFQIDENYDFYIFEVGTNHPGEMAILSRIISPDTTVIHNILPSHIGHFKNLDSIALEKSQVTKFQTDRGELFIPHDIACKETILKNKKSTVSVKEYDPQKITSQIDIDEDKTVTMYWNDPEKKFTFTCLGLNLFGDSLVACLIRLGQSFFPRKSELSYNLTIRVVDRRTEVVLTGKHRPLVIDDAYNANPQSVIESISRLAQFLKTKKQCCIDQTYFILGDMLELGNKSQSYHLQVLEELLALPADFFLYLTGKEMKQVSVISRFKNVSYFDSDHQLLDQLVKVATPRSLFYFKASNGMGFDRLIRKLILKLNPIKI